MRPNPNEDKINELCDSYKQLILKDKSEKDKRKKYPMSKRRAYQSIAAQDLQGILKPYQKFMQSPTQAEENEQLKAIKNVTFNELMANLAAKSRVVTTFDDEVDREIDINSG